MCADSHQHQHPSKNEDVSESTVYVKLVGRVNLAVLPGLL